MINSQNLINKICSVISAGGLTALQTCQTTGALTILNNPVVSVASFANLPSAVTYAGRLIYVNDENRYYSAVDGYWINNLSSKLCNYNPNAYAWGTNNAGQLGDNTIVSKTSPILVAGGFTDWCQVSAGGIGAIGQQSLGLRTNGTLWTWGYNNQGQLGDNTTVAKSSPVLVVGGFTDWYQFSSGGLHNLGVRTNGTAWAWGSGTYGRLGQNTANTARSSPVLVAGGFTDWCQVSAGYQHSLGVRTSGTAWSWGRNNVGQLGDNTIVSRSSPVLVAGGFADWSQVSAGCAHSLGVRTNGTAWAWGSNTFSGGAGQLGDNTGIGKSSPVSVVGGFTDWRQVSAGREHSLGIRTNGTAWAWGNAAFGKVGDCTTVTKSSPVSVVGGFTDWCQVSAGGVASSGVRINGTAWVWGAEPIANGLRLSSPVQVLGCGVWSQVCISSHAIGIRQTQKGF